MKVKTSELIGPALDWAVAKAKGTRVQIAEQRNYGQRPFIPRKWVQYWSEEAFDYVTFDPSADWEQGGSIIEREGIALWLSTTPEAGKWAAADNKWMELDPESDEFLNGPDPWHGPTPLVAAMRCFVASKLGDEVDVPEELLT